MKNLKIKDCEGLSGIYRIINTKTKKSYIGSSKNIYYRLREHLSHLRHNKHHSLYMQRSFNKYSEDDFIAVILEICEKETKILREREKYWIDYLQPEYNSMQNPVTWEITPEAKIQISRTLKKKYAAGEIKAFDHPESKIAVTVYDFKEEIVSEYESISQLQREFLPLSKASIKGNLRNNWYFSNNFLIVPKDIGFDECIKRMIETRTQGIPILKVTKDNIELVNKKDYSKNILNKINNNRGKITKIEKIEGQFLHIGFLKKLMPDLTPKL